MGSTMKITCDQFPIFAASMERSFASTARVYSLLGSYRTTENKDILRACVPLLHAAVEDCMRNAIYFILTTRGKNNDLIHEVPLLGANENGRVKKYTLGDLANFQELSVEDLLEKSIAEYVNRLTFNNTSDIAKWFYKCSTDTGSVKQYFPKMEKMFLRRHEIVHNGDFQSNRSLLNVSPIAIHDPEATKEQLNDISAELIEDWANIACMFCERTVNSFLPKEANFSITNLM